VFSSTAEGFSNSILEYMAAARAVVATDVGGAREAVVDSQTGYLVRSDDDDAMTQRISYLLNQPALAREMGKRGPPDSRREVSLQDAARENTPTL